MPNDPQATPYIHFDHVSKSFGDKRVLDDVSFDVWPGETVCILGRSGVGKSVSLHHIMGFLKPDSGRVIVAHEDVTDYDEVQMEAIRKKVTIGVKFDQPGLGLRNPNGSLSGFDIDVATYLPHSPLRVYVMADINSPS